MSERKEFKEIDPQYMMCRGEIWKGEKIDDGAYSICHIYGETDDCWIGIYITGVCIMDRELPKEFVRELTDKERDYYRVAKFQVSDQPPFQLDLT